MSAIEHKAVAEAAARVAHAGGTVRTVRVGADGVIDLDHLEAVLDDTVVVVSVMCVNNETGIVQPLDAVAERVGAGAPRASNEIKRPEPVSR